MSELIDKAETEIRLWGSCFDGGNGTIEKDRAVKAMHHAFEKMTHPNKEQKNGMG